MSVFPAYPPGSLNQIPDTNIIERLEKLEKEIGAWEKVESLGPHTSTTNIEVRKFFGMLQFRGACTMKNEVIPNLSEIVKMPAGVRPVAGKLTWASDASTGFVGGIGFEANGEVIWRSGEIPAGGVVLSFEGTWCNQ